MLDNLHQQLDDISRLLVLNRSRLLDSPVEESFDRLTKLASKILDAPISLISLVEPNRQFFKSQVGLPEPLNVLRETPISHSFCQHVVISGKPFIVENAREHSLVMDNPAIDDIDVIAYLGIPLTTSDGWHLGSFCVIDNEPRVWTDEEVETMQTLADSVTNEIQLRLNSIDREQFVEQLRIRNENLDAFSHTVSHNLKNSISAIIGWADLSTAYSDRVSFDELLATMSRIRDLSVGTNTIIDALMLLAGIGRVDVVETEMLPMSDVVEDALTKLELQISTRNATIILPDTFPDCVSYRYWVEEVWVNYISNALKYGGTPPKIELGADVLSDDKVRYWVKDNGLGISQADQGELFKTFSRLPQTEYIEGHGLGLSIVKRIVDKLGGEVMVESTVGEGSIFSFTLPTE